MILRKGDLIRIPADTCLVKGDPRELAIIEKYMYTKSPKIGIFVEHEKSLMIKIYLDNEYWTVSNRDICPIRNLKPRITRGATC
tara:strand:+ start:640 stop:891 length:252 start_codon:yes stop_codon:yes gene_type:complete